MKKVFLILPLLAMINSYAQSTCGTEDLDSATVVNLPWFGNNTWLNNFVDSIEAPFNCTNCRIGDGPTKTLIQIPINAVVYYNNTYTDISNDKIEAIINDVNRIYEESNVLIKLYLRCSIKHIFSSYASLNTMSEVNNVLGYDNEDDALNIHFSRFSSSLNLCGIARYPHALPKRYSCIVNYNCYSSTLAHEIGHTLSLPHTFNKNICRNDCWQECVSRTRTQEAKCLFTSGKKKCEVNGDCFCDTDADIHDHKDYNHTCSNPVLSTDSYCNRFDNYGIQWYSNGNTNTTTNNMSYWDCGDLFSKMQRGAMYLYSLKFGLIPAQNNNASFYSNSDVDVYENDNYYQNSNNWFDPYIYCNVAILNKKQYHTFHHNFNPTSACDIDWVYFQNLSATAKPYVIQTQEVVGKPKPDTKITLYGINGDGTLGAQLAFNDDIVSGTNLFSKITTANLAFGSYAVKIENKVTNVSDNRSKGHYYLRIDECFDKTNVNIVGDAIICTSKPYSISDLPTGANVVWSVIPAGAVTFANTGNSTVATTATTGNATLKAVITMCGVTYELTKPIGLGVPFTLYTAGGCGFTDAIMETGFDEGPCNIQCYSAGGPNKTWCFPDAYNATSVSVQKAWSYPSNYNFWSASNNNISLFFKGANQSLEIKRTMTNACGSAIQYYCFGSNNIKCSTQMMMMSGGNQTLKIYPNPTMAGNTITLELFLEEEQINFENSIIQLIDGKNKIVLEKSGSKEMKELLTLPSISSGKYYISVTNANGTISEELIIDNIGR